MMPHAAACRAERSTHRSWRVMNRAANPQEKVEPMRLALFQPDIPQNTGTILRLAACLGVPVDVIEPCGFPFSDKGFRRAGLDYLELVQLTTHLNWHAFMAASKQQNRRLILLSTKAERLYTEIDYAPSDVLMVGRESSGVPDAVHRDADLRIRIPIKAPARSLNVALAAAMVLSEGLRQTGAFPSDPRP